MLEKNAASAPEPSSGTPQVPEKDAHSIAPSEASLLGLAVGSEPDWVALLAHLPGGVSRFDRDLRFLFVNAEQAHWYGRSVSDVTGRKLSEVLPPERYARTLEYLKKALHGKTAVYENRVDRGDGDLRVRQITFIPERNAAGAVVGVISFIIDVTESRRAESALVQSQTQLLSLFQALPDLVFTKDSQGRFIAANGMFTRFFGIEPGEEIATQRSADLLPADISARWEHQDSMVLLTGNSQRSEERLSDAAGARIGIFDVIKAPLRDAAGRIVGVLGVARDVSARRQAESEVERLAYYDTLTDLPNRRLFTKTLRESLSASARCTLGAVLLIDLDHFKTINDTLGHDAGDRLLQLVAARLADAMPAAKMVARFGGDDFAVLLEEPLAQRSERDEQLSDVWRDAVQSAAQDLLEILQRPFRAGERRHFSPASIGIALYGGASALSVDELLKRAELAMYEAKARGRNGFCLFDPAMEAALAKRAVLETDLRAGIGRGELRLHYQAIMDVDGKLSGAEALVRWSHPQHGLMAPCAFIGLAEDSGLIIPMGDWVLRSACMQLARWKARAATQALSIAVNVSARQFRHPDFVAMVRSALDETGADATLLRLEVTESLLFHDMADVVSKMGLLRAFGISMSLDDFGTGYSSLTYLKRLPIDQIKIDRSFVADVLSDRMDAAIVRAVLSLAASLELEVVAEGVETIEQFQWLRDEGCRLFQGFHFSRPKPANELEKEMGLTT